MNIAAALPIMETETTKFDEVVPQSRPHLKVAAVLYVLCELLLVPSAKEPRRSEERGEVRCRAIRMVGLSDI